MNKRIIIVLSFVMIVMLSAVAEPINPGLSIVPTIGFAAIVLGGAALSLYLL